MFSSRSYILRSVERDVSKLNAAVILHGFFEELEFHACCSIGIIQVFVDRAASPGKVEAADWSIVSNIEL